MEKFEKKVKIWIWVAIIFVIIVLILIVLQYLLVRYKTTLTITSSPDNITVVVNNQGYQTPITIKAIKPGSTRVEAYQDGYDFQVRYVNVKIAQDNQINIKLEKISDAGPVEGAPLDSEPTAQITNLPYKTDHFQIEWDSAYSKYLIVPSIPFVADQSPEDRLAKNWSQYEKYGKEAISWLKSQSVTPTNDNIEWWNQEFWPEGKSIKY